MKTNGILVLALALLAPGTVHAAGTQLPMHGVRAIGVGGAMTAGATGMDAFWHNPSLLDETTVGLSVSFVNLQASYARNDQLVENEATPVPNPSLGAIWQATEQLSVGLAAYAPMGAQYKFPETGPQRYALVENDKSTVLFIHLAAAYRLGGFSFGGGLQVVNAHVRQRSVLSGYSGLFGYEEDPELDVLSELELKDPFTLTGNAGVSYTFETLTVGASVQFPYTLSGDASFRNRLPSSVFFDAAGIDGDQAYLEVPHPWTVRAGAQWRPLERLQLEAALKWEDWSTQQRLVLDPQGRITLHGVPAIGDYIMKPIVVDRRMRDTFSLHFGVDGEVVTGLHLRGGVFWEQSAFSDETFTVAVFDDEKIGASAGASWHWYKFRFDVAVSRVFQGTREIDNSEFKQVNPTNAGQAAVVGDGTYRSAFWVGGAGVAWIYDQ